MNAQPQTGHAPVMCRLMRHSQPELEPSTHARPGIAHLPQRHASEFQPAIWIAFTAESHIELQLDKIIAAGHTQRCFSGQMMLSLSTYVLAVCSAVMLSIVPLPSHTRIWLSHLLDMREEGSGADASVQVGYEVLPHQEGCSLPLHHPLHRPDMRACNARQATPADG